MKNPVKYLSIKKNSFQLTVKSNFVIALVLPLFVIGQKISRHFVNQSEVKPKPMVSCSHTFSRAWSRLHVFASRSDWLVGSCASVLIHQINY